MSVRLSISNCAQCDAEFMPKESRQRFCTHACYARQLACRRSASERFWSSVDQSAGDGACWPWTRGRGSFGYGHFWLNGRAIGAHVVAYEWCVGQVPPGLWVLHHCDNPPCCNPKHLYAGSAADNSRDRSERGRVKSATGERNGASTKPERVLRGEQKSQAKLTWAEVREIRRRAASSERQSSLAQAFGIDASLVSRIVAGKDWPLRGGEQPW